MMFSSIRKIFMNDAAVRSSPKHVKFLNSLIGYAEKHANKYFMRGGSKYRSVTIKMTPMMKVKEIKIHPEALIDTNVAPRESMEYLRIFCDVIEQEILSAYNDAQDKIYKKAEQSPYKMKNVQK